MNRLTTTVLRIASFAVIFLTCICSGAYGDNWEFVVAPYGQLPTISGESSLGRIEDAEVDVSMSDILDKIKLGGMLQVEAHHSN